LLHSLDGQYVAEQAKELAQSGFAVVVSDQRLPGTGNYLPRLEDSFCALGWLYANAETYPFDLERVFVMAYGVNAVIAVEMGLGQDAAAYLSNCAYQLPEGQVLRGIITQAGVFDFTDLSDAPYLATGIEEQFLGVSYDDNPDLWTEVSVQQRVNEGLPPHLLITPEDFEMVPKSLSETYAAALSKVDVDATVFAVPETDFFTILVHPETTAAIQTFMGEF
jgi:acetyl esterase/lipase